MISHENVSRVDHLTFLFLFRHRTLLVSCVSIMKLWTCFSARVSSNFLETTATSNAVQPAPFNIGSILNQLFFGWVDRRVVG